MNDRFSEFFKKGNLARARTELARQLADGTEERHPCEELLSKGSIDFAEGHLSQARQHFQHAERLARKTFRFTDAGFAAAGLIECAVKREAWTEVTQAGDRLLSYVHMAVAGEEDPERVAELQKRHAAFKADFEKAERLHQ